MKTSEQTNERKDTFLQGAFILTLAGIVVKIIGSLNWFILSRVIGGEGIGLYMMAFPLYILALSVSSAGVPVAISILTAERLALNDYAGAKKVFHTSLKFLAVTGILFSVVMYYGSGWLIEYHIVRDARAYYSILALAPAVFFVTLLSSYRGYFQGWQTMKPSAVSQIVEQLVRVATMIIFAWLLLPYGLEFGAAGASLGAAPAALAALLVLLYYQKQLNARMREVKQEQSSNNVKDIDSKTIMMRIVKLALPVSFASIMLPIVSNLDLFIVPARLEVAGYSVAQATELFGYLTGMAVPFVNLLTILTASLATSIVPAISEAATLNDPGRITERIRSAMRLSNLITIPGFIGLYVLATPISEMLYGTPKVGLPLEILSVSVFLLGIHQVTTGVLQGLGHTYIPVINMILAATVKVILNWVLTAMPALGIAGASWATVADVGIAALLNLIYMRYYTGCGINFKDTKRILIAAGLTGGVVAFSYSLLMQLWASNTAATVFASMIGSVLYVLCLVIFKSLVQEDLERIPAIGSRLAASFKRAGLLK